LNDLIDGSLRENHKLFKYFFNIPNRFNLH